MQKVIAPEICSSVEAPFEIHESALLVPTPVCISFDKPEKASSVRHTNEDLLDNLNRVDEEAFNAIYDRYVYQLINFSRPPFCFLNWRPN